MYSLADWQSAILGLKPKFSPLQRISKAEFLEDDDVFSVEKAVELNIGSS